jgi:hypothetical protein
MRSAGGTKSGNPSRVTALTKFRIACFVAPSFQEGNVSPDAAVCALAEMDNAGSAAKAESNARRLTPEK